MALPLRAIALFAALVPALAPGPCLAQPPGAGSPEAAPEARFRFLGALPDGHASPSRAHRRPPGAPAAAVLLPASAHGTTSPAARAVIYLHGWNACVRVLALEGQVSCVGGAHPAPAPESGWGLLARASAGDPRVAFVIPQLAWKKRSGSPGPYRSRATYDALWDALRAEHGIALTDNAGVTLMAHSAGFETALAMLGYDGRIDEVVLFDSMYAGAPEFARWVLASPGRRLVSVHTGRGGPQKQTKLAASIVRRREGAASVRSLGAGEPLVLDARFTAVKTKEPHREVPVRLLESVLRALRAAR